jgi:hypothetical protein
VGLDQELPRLLPLACEWAKQQSELVQADGRPLNGGERDLAVKVGVLKPENVRLLSATWIPTPTEPSLKAACEQLNFLGPDALGLTLGYSVILKKPNAWRRALVAHELRHVAQYESFGSIEAFLAVYLPELLKYGYDDAPLERDAAEAVRRIEEAG